MKREIKLMITLNSEEINVDKFKRYTEWRFITAAMKL